MIGQCYGSCFALQSVGNAKPFPPKIVCNFRISEGNNTVFPCCNVILQGKSRADVVIGPYGVN
jgi:hypothetical protein